MIETSQSRHFPPPRSRRAKITPSVAERAWELPSVERSRDFYRRDREHAFRVQAESKRPPFGRGRSKGMGKARAPQSQQQQQQQQQPPRGSSPLALARRLVASSSSRVRQKLAASDPMRRHLHFRERKKRKHGCKGPAARRDGGRRLDARAREVDRSTAAAAFHRTPRASCALAAFSLAVAHPEGRMLIAAARVTSICMQRRKRTGASAWLRRAGPSPRS